MKKTAWRQLGVLWFLINALPSLAEARIFQSFHEVVTQIEPSVVHIQSKERPLRPANGTDPYAWFFQSQPPQNSTSFPLGTGFLIQPAGYCVTSFQIVDGLQHLEIITTQKKRYAAEYVGGDRQSDLALLRIKDAKGLRTLDFADSDRVRAGDPVLGFGFPLGFKPMVTSGMIAARGQVMGAGPFDAHLMLDLPTHPGNLGGPLVDTRGRVIGLLAAPGGNLARLGFALPSRVMQRLIQDLIRDGKLSRPWLGLVARNLPSLDSVAELYDPSIRAGVLVDNLIVEGPAARASLQVGDLILSLGEQKIQNISDLQDFLRKSKPGQRVQAKVFRRRAGQVNIPIQLGEIPGAQDLPQERDLY
ncbi:S1C family serine protease [Oligoflexus tunisiensis]|uniref:S1C family serine protease n=1 Tax=Oligoflexus tunisiensis TaxID=708132 RepID=UPI00114C9B04|nr:trypsin-like peptidase domain-containing protein [Oligoflexus tunisiensis]